MRIGLTVGITRIIQSAEAQAALTKARELADEQYRKASGTAAVVGATDESVAQAKKAAGEVISDTASGIATKLPHGRMLWNPNISTPRIISVTKGCLSIINRRQTPRKRLIKDYRQGWASLGLMRKPILTRVRDYSSLYSKVNNNDIRGKI